MLELLTDVESECNSSWQNQSTNEINEDNELHTEAESATKISDEHKFHKVVHCTVDPSTSLREQNRELFRNSGFADGLRNEDLLALGECSEHERR